MTEIRHLLRNTKGHDYVVGDLHGCVDDLYQELRTLSFDFQNDRLFSVGDLIDRGPNSKDTLELLNETWFHAARGNHEELMIQSVLNKDAAATATWMLHGGEWSSNLTTSLLTTWAEKLTKLPYAIAVGKDEDRFNIIHAEFIGTDQALDIGKWSDEVKQQLLWGRSLYKRKLPANCQEGLSRTYCGHTVVEAVVTFEQQTFLDTGAYLRYLPDRTEGFLTIVNASTA
jgi:serine/threonine protein phosphatase 1